MPNHTNQAHMRKIAIFLFFLFTAISGFSQGKSVQGKVTGENGNPLEGVTIQVRGNAKGFQTDKNGAFTVPVPATGKPILVFTYVGYKTYTLSTTAGATVSISLEKMESSLEDVVVVGYNSIKRKDLT